MDTPIRVEAVDDVLAEVSARRTLNLALQTAGVPLVDGARIQNRGAARIEGARWFLSLEPHGASVSVDLPTIHPGEEVVVPAPELRIPTERLLAVRQPETAQLAWSIADGTHELARGEQVVDVLPWDEWLGDRAPPAVLAAFVLPDDPVVATLVRRLTGRADSGIDRVRALYDAIRALGIRAVDTPGQFEQRGLRVRLAESVLREQKANGVELALLFAACLERMGFGALLTSVGGRLIPGLWLGDDRFPEGVVFELPRVRSALLVDQLVIFDPLIALHDPTSSFELAVAAAKISFVEDAAFRYTLDVRAVRAEGWRPLPGRPRSEPKDDGGSRPIVREILAEAATQPIEPAVVPGESPPVDLEGVASRFRQWKDRLLDLSLRNRLLAFRIAARTTVPLEVADLRVFVDRLGTDAAMEIVPNPVLLDEEDRSTVEMALVPRSEPTVATAASDDTEFDEVAPEAVQQDQRRADLERGVIHAALGEAELLARAVSLDRATRLDLEEGGANTLFAAVGFLRWSEIEGGEPTRMAPLILIPVSIEIHRSTRKVRLRRVQEDPIANVTLVEKLRRDFELDLSAITVLETEDHGLDVEGVLAAARAAIAAKRGWEIRDEVALGQFLFTKFLLWRDLEDNAALLLQSPVVQHIARRVHSPYPNPVEATPPQVLDDRVPPSVLPLVVDADSTQMAAIHSALQGRSFVLQGPPGTGKSQTITNLVAAAIATGRTVLVVAEKMAALDVVHRRLREAGLGDSCLELHSHKTNKRQVVQSLAGSLRRELATSAPQWDVRSAELGASRQELNAYVRALHVARPLGTTFYEVTSRQLTLRTASRVVLPCKDLPATTDAARRGMDEAAARFATAAAGVEPVGGHPWADTRVDEWSAAGEQAVAARLAKAIDVTRAIEVAAKELGSMLGVEPPSGAARLRDLATLAAALAEGTLPSATLDPKTADAFAERVREFVSRHDTWQARSRSVATRWHPGIYKVDLERLALRFAEWSRKWWPIAFMMLWSARRELVAHARKGLPDLRTISADLGVALQVEQVRDRLGNERKGLIAASGGSWTGNEPPDLVALTERADKLRERVRRVRLGGVPIPDTVFQLADPATPADRRKALGKRAADATRLADRWIAAVDAVYELVQAEADPPSDTGGPTFEGVRARLVRWQEGVGRFRGWALYGQAASEMAATSLGPVVEAHRAGTVTAVDVPSLVERSFQHQWIDAVRDAEPALRGFSGPERHRQVLRFRGLDRQHLELAMRQVAWCLEQRLPRVGNDVADASEPGILLREAAKKTRQKAIRRLLREIPNLLARLKPCLLMSPLSVAQYLPAEGRRFDLVVFDEASQIGTHDAIGALARGAQVVVVGDSRQLPPTTFFQRVGGEDQADENDFDELESILDEAVAAGLPEQLLGWHYRSRHEDLIRFSNDHYYGGRLAVFPAARGRSDDLGLTWHPVPNGAYDKARTRTNRVEAQALVDHLVASLLRTAPGARTFGVVTFSQAQQVLVNDLLDEARRLRPEIEPHFVDMDEAVFVKNLENVQGDERDEILFSIGYGPDDRGRVWMNFGPLNRQGGERRLNVAVTRARLQLRVFSTLTHDQIDLSRTRARGARHLREFLRYAAENGTHVAEVRAVSRDFRTSFERAVYEALLARGWTVDVQVGCGAYRIDLAVHNPDVPGEYLLGVELDGEAYQVAATARDRDRLRYEVLEGLGWRLHRVWSTDWWFDPHREMVRLERALDDATTGARIADDESTDAPQEDDIPTTSDPLGTPVEPYVELVLEEVSDDPKTLHAAERVDAVRQTIQRVLDVEAPIHVAELTRRVGAAFGVTKVTARAQKRVLSVAKKLVPPAVVRGSFVWAANVDPATFDRVRGPTADGNGRDVEHLPPEEVACAAARVLADNLAMPHVDLVRETARLFGILRVGRKVAEGMGQGIALLVERGHAEMQEERVVLRR